MIARNPDHKPSIYEQQAASILARMATKIKPTDDGCWEWTGSLNSKGYPLLKVAGVARLAHRVAHELHYGPIPEGWHVHHKCCNPRCVRPMHIESVTAEANRAMQTLGVGDIEDEFKPW